MERILEVRPAEGGDDSRLFAGDLLAAYRKLCDRLG
jgi:protein subunit release factor A